MRDTRHMIARATMAVVLALLAADPAVVKEIEQFRAKHEEDYRRQFVTLAGLSAIKDGVNTVGSAASNAVVLPKGAPASVGRLIVSGGKVRFEPAPGVNATIKEQ